MVDLVRGEPRASLVAPLVQREELRAREDRSGGVRRRRDDEPLRDRLPGRKRRALE